MTSSILSISFWSKLTSSPTNIFLKSSASSGDISIISIGFKECEHCDLDYNCDKEECDYWTTEGYQIEEDNTIEEEFKTIYGTNDFFDLTKSDPKSSDWDNDLSNAWKRDPQLGCNMLLTKTQLAIAQGRSLTDKDQD